VTLGYDITSGSWMAMEIAAKETANELRIDRASGANHDPLFVSA